MQISVFDISNWNADIYIMIENRDASISNTNICISVRDISFSITDIYISKHFKDICNSKKLQIFVFIKKDICIWNANIGIK